MITQIEFSTPTDRKSSLSGVRSAVIFLLCNEEAQTLPIRPDVAGLWVGFFGDSIGPAFVDLYGCFGIVLKTRKATTSLFQFFFRTGVLGAPSFSQA